MLVEPDINELIEHYHRRAADHPYVRVPSETLLKLIHHIEDLEDQLEDALEEGKWGSP
jgi:hypothetical protein